MMNYFIPQLKKFSPILSLMVVCWFLLVPSISLAQDKVVLQLKWKHGFQFAGYYAAQELGYYNDAGLDYEIERFFRYSQSFSVIMVDIDNFKDVNDSYGHQVGDKVIMQIATILSDQIRVTDTLGRWGSEEIMLICPENGTDDTMQLAEKLRRAVEEQVFATVGHQTASFGFATYKKGDKANDVIKRADDALYDAKERGRNRVFPSALNSPQ